MGGFYIAYLESLCRRRGWRDPSYETYRSSSGFTCLVLVNGREYQTDLAYESNGLAQENAAMRAFMVCQNFSINGGMLARNGVVQGLPANKNSSRHKRRGSKEPCQLSQRKQYRQSNSFSDTDHPRSRIDPESCRSSWRQGSNYWDL
ncbi:hypothetical protein DL95DRAFT_428900 [Leptodontidium sp. 2 PMI_412]|nr:hypothetical protein DL95DRAFT_428900 [Leptodontidium sp. 2 PMI_412]